MSEQIGRIYEFGDFRLDTAAKTLRRANEPVALTPKVFDTLQFFVQHAGELLEKDQLMQGIWQDRFVEESNLTFNIKMLRKALQDDAQRPRFIETVPRRGYRFIAEVKAPSTEPETVAENLPKSLARTTKVYWAIAGSVVIVSLIFLLVWLRLGRGRASATTIPIFSASFKSERLSNTGSVHALITPDGKYAAYTNETGGKQSIWLRKLETSENIQIVPGIEGAYLGLAISHDGNTLYFVRRDRMNDPLTALYRVNTFGGIPVKITEQVEGWLSISPDDTLLSFVRCKYLVDDYCSLFVIDKDGKNERKFATQLKPGRITSSQFTRDGHSLVFAKGQSFNGGKDFGLYRIDLTGGGITEVSPSRFFIINRLVDLPNDEFLISARETFEAKSRIFLVSSTGAVKALTNDSFNYNDLSLNQLGDRMVVTQITNTFRINITSIDDLKSPKVLLAAGSVSFTPDHRILYASDEGDIWSINRDGSEQRQLTNNSSFDFSPRASPDRLYIYFASNRSGSNQVWRMNADGSNQIQVTKGEGGFPLLVTADGKFVYFYSGLNQRIWKLSVDTGDETQLSDKVMQSPAFSNDGKLVAYFVNQRDKSVALELMSIDTGQVLNTVPIEGERVETFKISWSPDAKTVTYTFANGEQAYLWQLNLNDRRPRFVANLGTEQIEDLATAPDGSGLALVRGKWIHDAVLIQGLK